MIKHRDEKGRVRSATQAEKLNHLQKHTREKKLANVTGGAFKLSKKGDQTVPLATWQNPHKQKSQKTLWTRRVRENQQDRLIRDRKSVV